VLAPIAREAWRRYRNKQLREDEFYCSEAQMAGMCHRSPELAESVTRGRAALRQQILTPDATDRRGGESDADGLSMN
jgi:hypothetical protein